MCPVIRPRWREMSVSWLTVSLIGWKRWGAGYVSPHRACRVDGGVGPPVITGRSLRFVKIGQARIANDVGSGLPLRERRAVWGPSVWAILLRCPTQTEGRIVMLTQSLSGLPAFLSYFATAIGLLALFLAVYVFITPYREITLIREGNAAAAASLGGAVLGSCCRWPAPSLTVSACPTWRSGVDRTGRAGAGLSGGAVSAVARTRPRYSRRPVATGVFLGALSVCHRHPQRRLHELLSWPRD